MAIAGLAKAACINVLQIVKHGVVNLEAQGLQERQEEQAAKAMKAAHFNIERDVTPQDYDQTGKDGKEEEEVDGGCAGAEALVAAAVKKRAAVESAAAAATASIPASASQRKEDEIRHRITTTSV